MKSLGIVSGALAICFLFAAPAWAQRSDAPSKRTVPRDRGSSYEPGRHHLGPHPSGRHHSGRHHRRGQPGVHFTWNTGIWGWGPSWGYEPYPYSPYDVGPLWYGSSAWQTGWRPFAPLPMANVPLVPLLPPVQMPEPAALPPAIDRDAFAFADVAGDAPLDPLQEIRRRASVLQVSTPAGRTRADRLISAGDEAFAEQNYGRAVSRYRDAIARAPDYAEAHFRLAHAYVASRRFNLALDNALIALELSGTARRDGFSLEEMYRGHQFAREHDDEQLADAARREPEDGGLEFLIGLTKYYGGQPFEAREHFRRANQFPGAHQAYTRLFLPVARIAEPDDAVPGGAR